MGYPASDGKPHSIRQSLAYRKKFGDYHIYFDDTIRQYEFSLTFDEEPSESTDFEYGLGEDNIVLEVSNIYIRNTPNIYQNLFIDNKRNDVVSKIITNKFSNCNWSAFGDSITNMGFYIQYTKEQMPFGSLTNHGIGGTCAIDIATNSGSVLIDSCEDEIKSADLVTIAYGCNDSRFFGKSKSLSTGENVELGTIEAVGTTHNKGSFYGALQYMIEKVLSWNPKVKIVIVIQPSNTCISSLTNYNETEMALAEETVQAQIDVAKLYRIPYADFFHHCGMVYGFNATTYIPDGVHPTKQFGYNCSRELVSVLDRICINEKEIEV